MNTENSKTNEPHRFKLEVVELEVEVVLVHCNLVKNDYQHTSKVLFTFVPNKK